ncbi:virion structural protein [Salmonella phage SPAsTU]|nr:hypothetical protein STsAS_144 [Salmonella phage STsAS]AWN09165.1 virion structural protein [Salmonella phage SPAsTU]
MKTYPYDPRGINPECQFTEERIIDSDDPKDRVVMLDHRPFFEGLEVKLAGASIPLTRGKDYELEYALTPLDDSVTTPVFCGVQLINPDLRGAVVFTGQMLGGTFYSGLIEMLDELVKALNNPTSADWLLLDGRPSLYPATPSATSWADMLNKKYVASAVHDVELDAGAANDAIREKLAALKDEVIALGVEIEAFNYPAHIAATNPHDTTVAQNGAHPVDLKTPDTFLAYGKNLRTLTAEIRALGLQQSDIDKYISKWVSKESKGVFTAAISGTRALFRSPNGESEITFSTDAFTLKSNGSIILATGYMPGDTVTRFMEWKAGVNTLRIESTGSALGMDRLTLNGTTLLTTTALMGYQQDPGTGGGTVDPDDNKLYIEGRNGITFTGKGSKADPVTGTVTATKATTTAAGVVKLKKGPGTETSGVAATPDSLTTYEGDLSSYVLKATLLNNKAMTDGSRVLTKTDLGLGNADNTADLDKPLSDALAEAVTGLSPKGHHHDWSELAIPTASQTTLGIARYSNNQAGLAAGRGVTPNVLNELVKRLDVVAGMLASAKENTVTEFAAVRGKTWTVGASRTTLAVTDLNYFYLFDGQRKEGTVSGSIDLQTTPMFQWFSPDNQMERTWQNAVINSGAGVSYTGFEAPFPFNTPRGSQIGLTLNGMGNLSVVTVLAKTRLHCVTGKLKIWVSGGGAVTVYVDGEIVGAGLTQPAYLEVNVTAGWEEHCLAIKAECNDAAKAAAVRFEVSDGDYPLYASGTHTKVAVLQEFVTPMTNLRHYLYVNMITSALYSRAEPILDPLMNLERGYIGYIDVPSTGLVAGDTYTFDTTFDYGPSSELNAHFDVRKAHGVVKSDWSLTDNLRMLPLNKLDPLPTQWVFAKTRSNTSGSHLSRLDRGLFSYHFVSDTQATLDVQLFVANKYKTPYCWFTPYNPKEGNQATFEGSIVVDVESTEQLTDNNRQITFMALAKANSNTAAHRVLGWQSADNALTYGVIDNLATGSVGHNSKRLTTTTSPIAITPTVIKDTTVTNAAALDYYLDNYALPAYITPGCRWLLRYRYIVETRTLRLSVLSTAPDVATIRVQELEYVLPFDAVDYFDGEALGVEVQGIGVNEYVTVNHGLVEPKTTEVDISRFHYLRSLLESYIDRRTDTTASGFEDYTSKLVSVKNFGDNLDYPVTEYIVLPSTGEGYPDISHRGQLPLPFHRRMVNRGAAMPGMPSGYTWKGGVWKNGLILSYRPTRSDEYVTRVNVTMNSNYPGYIVVGSVADPKNTVAFNGTGTDEVNYVELGAKKPQQRVFIVFTPPAGEVPPLNATFTVTGINQLGNTTFIMRDTVSLDMRCGGDVLQLEKRNPYHITSAVWTWLLSVLATERQSAGNNSGEWAS